MECAAEVVSEQCGEEIAGHVRALGERVLLQIACESRKRLYLCFSNIICLVLTEAEHSKSKSDVFVGGRIKRSRFCHMLFVTV